MKLRLIAAMLALAAGTAGCHDLTTSPGPGPESRQTPRHIGEDSRADSAERGGTTMGSGD